MNKKSYPQNHYTEYRLWDRIAFAFAGTDKDALRSGVISQKDEDEQKLFGWSVLIAGLLTFGNVYFLGVYVCKTMNISEDYATLPAFAWAIFIMGNDMSLFNDVDLRKLWVRVLFLIASAVVFSYGSQLKIANNKIEDFIYQEVAEHNATLENKVIEVRQSYEEKIQQVEKELKEASANGNDWVRANGTYIMELRAQKTRLMATRDSMVQVTQLMNKKLVRKPDLSVYNRIVVYQKHFWLKDILTPVGIVILIFEGAPIFIRIRNQDSDYLYYNYFKRKMSRAEWRIVTLAQKVKLYHSAERIVRERFAKEEESFEDTSRNSQDNADSNKNAHSNGQKAEQKQPELFPRLDLDNLLKS